MNSLRYFSAVVFVCSTMSFPRSFVVAKLVCLGFFLFVHLLDVRWIHGLRVYPRILAFYCFVAIGGLVWSLIGLTRAGDALGVIDGLRLYVGWSAAFLIIMTLLRNADGLRSLHHAIVFAGLLIAMINLFGMYDQYANLGIFSEYVRKELQLAIGFHESYVQITSHNIGSLLFITPYLIALQFSGNARHLNGKLTKLSLVACILVSLFSGRRALWLCLVLTPLIIGFLALAFGSYRALRPFAQKLIFVMGCGLVFASIAVIATKAQPGDTGIGALDHVSDAFSAEDERTIQGGYLVSAFSDQPMIGSGFGAYAGYLRNDERPWLYELTYQQLLFNFGLAGSIYWLILAGIYFFLAGRAIREYAPGNGQPLCLIVGMCGLLIGAYSNPYLASFDFLLMIAILPYVASLRDTAHRERDPRALGDSCVGGRAELNLGT